MPKRPVDIGAVAVLVAVLASCGGSGDPESSQPALDAPLHFSDITAQTGIDMTPTSGEIPHTQILEVK